MNIGNIEARDREEDYINLNPLQTGGRTYPETRKAVTSYVDGYSVCDWCKGDLCGLEKPPVKAFLDDVAQFLGMDAAILTNGCREAKNIALSVLAKPGETIVVDGNKHYSTYVAAEKAGLKIVEVPSSGEPEYRIDPEGFRKVFEEVKTQTGSAPKAAVLTHVDGSYGNVADAASVGRICHEYSVPFILNTAYSSGRMPIDGKRLNADYITCSCHKSWAAGGGNIGLLAATSEFEEKAFKHSEKYPVKPLQILGCSTRGAATLALMASYPHVKERVKYWGKEVETARWLVGELEKIGIMQVGIKPTEHDLNFMVSDVLYQISQTHKKKNHYLASELKERGIVGLKSGLTKHFKMSTYGKTREQIEHIAWAFRDIVEKHG